MKKKLIIILAAAVILSVIPAGEKALAADSDFDFTFTMSPDEVPYSAGDIHCTVIVENLGSSPITWFDIRITTEDSFYIRRDVTVNPGSSRTFAFDAHFSPYDLDNSEFIQVTINNDGDSNPDGVKTKPFTIAKMENPVLIGQSLSPDEDFFFVGDLMEYMVTAENQMPGTAMYDFTTRVSIMHSDVEDAVSREVNHGTLLPGASVAADISYFFDLEDLLYDGLKRMSYSIYCTVLGETYSRSGQFRYVRFIDIDFSASLSAAPAVVAEGDTVSFTVDITNNHSDIERFEVRGEEFALFASAEGMDTGESGSITFDVPYSEDIGTTFTVIGYIEDYSESAETNPVSFSLATPEAVTDTPEAASDSPVADTPSPSAEETPTATPEPSSSAEAVTAETATPEAAPAETEPPPSEASGSDNILFYVIIVLIVLITAAVVVLMVMLLNKKKE